MITLDFSQVQSYEPAREGKYVARIEKVEEKQSQAGNAMLNVTFTIADGEYTGRKVFDNFVLTEKALWRVQALLSAAGIKAEGAVDLDVMDLIDKVVLIEVTVEEYNGQERNRVKSVKKAPDIIL